jgi:hypothetical protein
VETLLSLEIIAGWLDPFLNLIMLVQLTLHLLMRKVTRNGHVSLMRLQSRCD